MTKIWPIAFVLIALSLAAGGAAHAGDAPSEAAIIEALRAKAPLTRSLSLPDPARSRRERALIESLARKATRAITVEERNEVADIAASRPQVDLEIGFAFDSAAIEPAAMPVIEALGGALADGSLHGATFLVAGHTDAKGTAAYNQLLSERRAVAVKELLIARYGIAPERIIALGYGFERLKNAGDGLAAENRRVQVVNIASE